MKLFFENKGMEVLLKSLENPLVIQVPDLAKLGCRLLLSIAGGGFISLFFLVFLCLARLCNTLLFLMQISQTQSWPQHGRPTKPCAYRWIGQCGCQKLPQQRRNLAPDSLSVGSIQVQPINCVPSVNLSEFKRLSYEYETSQQTNKQTKIHCIPIWIKQLQCHQLALFPCWVETLDLEEQQKQASLYFLPFPAKEGRIKLVWCRQSSDGVSTRERMWPVSWCSRNLPLLEHSSLRGGLVSDRF
jgi:hypothetical protein